MPKNERWHKVGTIGTFRYGFGLYAMGQYKYSRRCLLDFMRPCIVRGSFCGWGGQRWSGTPR